MLLVVRCLILAIALVTVFVFSGLYCLLRPRHRDNVHVLAQIFSKVSTVLGIKLVVRLPKVLPPAPNVYVANHQNNYDIFTHTAVVPKGTVSIGKKSLAWIPFFGQLYWLSGNILIDRKNRHSAVSTMAKAAEKVRDEKLSVWVFPEGTRSRGRGLLPLKSGAFHTAIASGAPVVPVVASSQNDIKLNRWNNGTVIIEMMEPVATEGLAKSDVKQLSETVFHQMKAKLEQLDNEAAKLK
ncbi:1-acyl-sn-glycerol-3-phosphate acyltransferase [Shewanella sp. OPT22]|nr:1-acyl-sn-glycerol-3-phosphate acyltransferase [Shewanella sp. OPT22]